MIRSVAALALEGAHAFELGVFCEVFGIDRSDDGLPAYDFAVVSASGGSVPTRHGFAVETRHGPERLASADLVCVPAYDLRVRQPDRLAEELVAAVGRGARVLSICSGAFLLGQAGLLDGRRCTTHWRYTAELARRHPSARVETDVLYVEDGPVVTGAGTAAGVDTCLDVVRAEHGSAVANAVARRMVAAPHREGGQRQYRELPPPHAGGGSLGPLLGDLEARLEHGATVEEMARRVGLSPRTFARRFREETGTTPLRWLTAQRLLHARHRLETTDEPVAAVARRSGFGTADNLRRHFVRRLGVTPQGYRRTFRAPEGRRAEPLKSSKHA
ncbi:GlxA family transcriptional regulator [Streptomyces chumphonensis]|uniref:GlxA family transcriptional regulator n=1 Tax=Streptomyces chumphonensis TaxID=1214925 RepID=UPI003D761B05